MFQITKIHWNWVYKRKRNLSYIRNYITCYITVTQVSPPDKFEETKHNR